MTETACWPMAEQMIMGTALMDRKAVVDFATCIEPKHFSDPIVARDYALLIEMWNKGESVDLLTASMYVTKSTGQRLQDVAYRLTDYTRRVASTIYAKQHAAVLVDLWKTRRIKEISGRMYSMAPGVDVNEMRGELAALMADTAQSVAMAEATVSELSYEFHNSPAEARPMAWGIPGIDDLCGAAKGTLTVIGARPASGKSALAINMALNIAKFTKVWFVSLEMPKADIVARVNARTTGINLGFILQKRLSDDERDRIAKAGEDHADVMENLLINHAGSISTIDFMAQATRKVERDGFGLIVVDYMQLMTPDPKLFKTEYDRVTEISRVLRRTARDLDVPILALSQLRRKDGNDSAPSMTDLRSSGQIEQDAHVIILLSKSENGIRVNVAKNRNGVTGDFDVWSDLSCGRIGSKPIEHTMNDTRPALPSWTEAINTKDNAPF